MMLNLDVPDPRGGTITLMDMQPARTALEWRGRTPLGGWVLAELTFMTKAGAEHIGITVDDSVIDGAVQLAVARELRGAPAEAHVRVTVQHEDIEAAAKKPFRANEQV